MIVDHAEIVAAYSWNSRSRVYTELEIRLSTVVSSRKASTDHVNSMNGEVELVTRKVPIRSASGCNTYFFMLFVCVAHEPTHYLTLFDGSKTLMAHQAMWGCLALRARRAFCFEVSALWGSGVVTRVSSRTPETCRGQPVKGPCLPPNKLNTTPWWTDVLRPCMNDSTAGKGLFLRSQTLGCVAEQSHV